MYVRLPAFHRPKLGSTNASQVRGKKNLVIEKSLAGTIGLFVKFSTLQEYGVDKVFFLENHNVGASQRNVVFLVRGENAKKTRTVAGKFDDLSFKYLRAPSFCSDHTGSQRRTRRQPSIPLWSFKSIPNIKLFCLPKHQHITSPAMKLNVTWRGSKCMLTLLCLIARILDT